MMAVIPRREGDSIFVDGVDVKRAARTLRALAEAPQWEAPRDLNAALEAVARMLGFPNLHALNASVQSPIAAASPNGAATPLEPEVSTSTIQDYPATLTALVRDASRSFTLRKRLVEDENRDQLEALRDAETLHAVQAMRFSQATPVGSVEMPGAGGLEEQGIEALKRLYKVACGHSGQCRFIARFLLGLYNGTRFPFDLTDLRAIDTALYEDCIRVLNMDARLTKREIHTYFVEGGKKWEALAESWRVVDKRLLSLAAKSLAERVGFGQPADRAAADVLDILEGGRGSST